MSIDQYDFLLCIPQSKKALNDRFLLLKHTKTYFDEFKELYEKAKSKKFGKLESQKLKKILDDEIFQFSEIERGLLFAFTLSDKICDLKPEIQNMLRISNDYPPQDKEGNDKTFRKKLIQDLGRFEAFMPALRAKLVGYEIAYLLTNDESYLIHLLSITDKYFSCPLIIRKITWFRSLSIFSNNSEEKIKSKKFMKALEKVIKGSTKSKRRSQPYWRNHYYYYEVMSCIESSFTINDKKGLENYVQMCAYHWGIPIDFLDLIYNKADTSTNLALQIMEDKKMIINGEQFLKGYHKHIKKVKEKNIKVIFLPEYFFSILDLISVEPLFFTQFDPFENLNNFKLT